MSSTTPQAEPTDNTPISPLDTANPDLAALNKSLTTPHGSSDSANSATAQRAMSGTAAWKPSFERRQSWSKQEQKHALHMTGIGEVKSGAAGFTEKGG